MADPRSEAAYNEVFEDAPDLRQGQTIHHIRANSSIMQLKKILGECLNKAPLVRFLIVNLD